jgi:hypothetical protein
MRWKTCDNIRSNLSKDGVLLVDTPDDFYFALDALGARLWVAIESSPEGLTFEDILGVLENHLTFPKHKLANRARGHLQELHALALIEIRRES